MPSASSRICRYDLQLAASKYFVNASTYDARGELLSRGQSIPISVLASRTTVLPLDLNGIPYSLTVTPGSPGIVGSQGGGFTLYGTAAEKVVVNAQDVDGNIIAGVGSPSYALSLAGGSGWIVQGKASLASPNVFTIAPPGTSGSGAVVQVTATAPGSICKVATAHCTSSFSVINHLQTLFAGGACSSGCVSAVLAYAAPYTESPTMVSNSLSNVAAMATDASGNLFVASCNTGCGNGSSPDSVTIYAPPYTSGPAETITSGVSDPIALAIDKAGLVFVLNHENSFCISGPCYELNGYTPPYSGSPTVSTGQFGANLPAPANRSSIAVNSGGDLALAFCDGDLAYPTCETGEVLLFSPPTYGFAGAIVVAAVPNALLGEPTFDAAGDLFVTGQGGGLEYAPPFANDQPSLRTTPAVYPAPIAIDAAANLYIGGSGPSTVTVYGPPYANPQNIRRSSQAASAPVSLLLDAATNVFFVNSDGSAAMKAPPFNGTAYPIASQLKSVSSLAISP